MSIDYRLLHHFRISQRREMAARGELPARFQSVEPSRRTTTSPSGLPRLARAYPAARHARSRSPERGQVLTHLLNEDR